jgi:hypothetical protein
LIAAKRSVDNGRVGDRTEADLRARIFVDQMAAGDGELGLVGPVAAEFALSSDQDRAGFGMAKR